MPSPSLRATLELRLASSALALSWHPDVAGCESAGAQCSPTTTSPRPERRDARELRRLDGEGRGARGAEPLVCSPGDDVVFGVGDELAADVVVVVEALGGAGRNRRSDRPPGKGPAGFDAGRNPRAGGKASPARSDQGLDDDDRHAAALTDALRCSRSSCMFK
jgi:hypothetical protein